MVAQSSIAVSVQSVSDATQAVAGYGNACVLHAGGSISCWGDNRHYQLGNGSTTASAMPTQVPGITNSTQVAAAGASCALLSGGKLSCWAFNSQGLIGNGTKNDAPTPVGVNGFP